MFDEIDDMSLWANQAYAIPIVLEDAGLLAAFAHPNRLLFVGSRGFAQLPPTCISNSNGYIALKAAAGKKKK